MENENFKLKVFTVSELFEKYKYFLSKEKQEELKLKLEDEKWAKPWCDNMNKYLNKNNIKSEIQEYEELAKNNSKLIKILLKDKETIVKIMELLGHNTNPFNKMLIQFVI